MLHAHPVILSKVKDLAGTLSEPGMLCSAQRDTAPVSTVRPQVVGAARRRAVANAGLKQKMCPGSSPRVMEALCQSSS
jgi:hypothetical protein